MSSLKAVVDTFILQKMMQKNLSSFSCLELAVDGVIVVAVDSVVVV